MIYFSGFDAAIYPGDAAMMWLKTHSNLDWCGYYLSPAPNLAPAATSWRGRRAALADNWGLAPVYLGQQVRHGALAIASTLTFPQGCLDAEQAADNALRDGFRRGTCLYLDWEDGGALSVEAKQYVRGWVSTVRARAFAPGLYCSYLRAAEFAATLTAFDSALLPRFWCYQVTSNAEHPLQESLCALPRIDPAGCGYAGASSWQREQNAWFIVPPGVAETAPCLLDPPNSPDAPDAGLRIVADFSTSSMRDPGQPA